MKHLKCLPFLIGAAAYMPRVHAAEMISSSEPSTWSMVLICVALVLLAGRSHSNGIKIKD
ncbi:hypothetical protein GJ699_14455 [Duganella sp. FT80W]|uniref:PEP-CTERM sorting domain-containing protein n=1 Tax=Duganella guangzhouensis TaxID=2666084 RepID=A0A6I2L2Y7_9BURK|nr:hypothetical protein [Duganella guangzhouensis]MRW91194.1 hypothetical protein [Duganella guangzhouensis]